MGDSQMERHVYMDHAATTPTDPEVVEAMLPWLGDQFGNPSTIYALGGEAARAVGEARATIAAQLGAETDEIYFTSGGTESDNWPSKVRPRRSRTRAVT